MYKVGTPVLHVSRDFPEAIGIIVEVDEESIFQYRIVFPDDNDEDWFTNENGNVTEMVEAYKQISQEVTNGTDR